MNITLEANPHDAPCCIKLIADNGQDRLIQTDWDYPAIASVFGWSVQDCQVDGKGPCQHENTDGTVTCSKCGLKAGDFIAAARKWIVDHDGAEAEDPGYFEEEA